MHTGLKQQNSPKIPEQRRKEGARGQGGCWEETQQNKAVGFLGPDSQLSETQDALAPSDITAETEVMTSRANNMDLLISLK